MPLSDFYSTPVTRLPFGGRVIEVRPLTLEQTLRLWDALTAEERLFLAESLAGKIPASVGLTAIFRALFAVLFPVQGEDGSEQEWAGLFQYYLREHQWERILQEIFGLGQTVEDSGDESDIVDWLVVIERGGGRKVEEAIQMRVEAFISYRDAFVRDLRRRSETVRHNSTPGKNVVRPESWDEMFDVTPMDEVEPLEIDN